MTCIIIEDEVPAQEILITYLEKVPDIELKGVFNSPLKANAILKQEKIDVLFLDINLPTISGLNFLKTLSRMPKVIVTTAYSDYAAESFEYEAIVDYLVKPFSFERFLKALNRLRSVPTSIDIKPISNITDITSSANSIFINVDKTLHKVAIDDILYVQSDRNYVTVVTKTSKFSFIDTLKNWNEYLTQDCFVQIHKSFIVNIDFIDKLTGNIAFVNQEKIPVGRSYKEVLFAAIKPIN